MQACDKVVLTANDLIAMGFKRSMAYSLLNREDMPVVKIGRSKFMHAEKFHAWLDALVEEDEEEKT